MLPESKPNAINSTLAARKLLLLVHPILLIMGLITRFARWVLLGEVGEIPKDHFLLGSKGPLNMIFAAHSFQMYLFIFVLLSVFMIYNKSDSLSYTDKQNSNANYLPLTSSDFSNKRKTKMDMIARQCLKLAILYCWITILIVWFFGDSLYDRILKLTGGQCSNGDPNLNYHQCLLGPGNSLVEDPNYWIGGIKISGHSLILSCFSVCLTIELSNAIPLYHVNKANDFKSSFLFSGTKSIAFLIAITLVLLQVWNLLFIITAIYYHTVFEKIVGIGCGSLVPYLLYIKFDSFFDILI